MGISTSSQSELKKGEGFRIIEIKNGSPFANKSEPFFDFIVHVEVDPAVQQKSPSQILDKLSNNSSKKKQQRLSLIEILNGSLDRVVKVKLVSTKYRNVRTIEVVPNNKWNGSSDLLGITLRKERYDEVFDTYSPISDIKENSPVKKAGLKQNQFLIGCLEFSYSSIGGFVEGVFERFYDKQIKDKKIHIAVFDIVEDELTIRQVELKRGWGGNGLLGCQFLQGLLNKFPNNFQAKRMIILQKERQKKDALKAKIQLAQCDGVSRSLIETLKNKKNRNLRKQYNKVRNFLSAEPPIILLDKKKSQQLVQRQIDSKPELQQDKQRIEILERKVSELEETLSSLRQYLNSVDLNDESRLNQKNGQLQEQI